MRAVIVVFLFGAWQIALGAGQSYMSLVGELYAGVELPRRLLSSCKEAYPKESASLEAQYNAWRARNEVFLSRAAVLFANADARLRSDGHALSEFEAPFASQVRASYDLSVVCRAYDNVLAAKGRQFRDELGRLMEVVANADRELSNREQQR